jgi:hypothetical protein
MAYCSSELHKTIVEMNTYITWKVDMGQTLQLEELNKIRNIQLTRTEFAESLGLKPTSVFVRNMFLMVDKDGNGFVGLLPLFIMHCTLNHIVC